MRQGKALCRAAVDFITEFIVIIEIKHGMKCNFIPTSQGRKLDGEVQEGSWTPLLRIAQCALLAAVT